MAPRSWWIGASGLVLLGAVVGADVAPAATVDAGRPRTVAAALGLDDPRAAADLDRRRAIAVAWLTARCMAGRGFVHVALVEPGPEVPDADLDPIAWAERWGFGISTAAGLPAPISAADPNLVRIAEMPPEVRRAAMQALLGDGRNPGCAALAGRTVHGLRDRELAPLRQDLVGLGASIEQDPEARATVDHWKACVGTKAERRDYLASLTEQFRRRTAELQAMPDATAALQVEERASAVRVARCEMAHSAARARVRERLEAPFVTLHRHALEGIGARIRRVESAYPDLPGSDPEAAHSVVAATLTNRPSGARTRGATWTIAAWSIGPTMCG